MSTTTTEMTAAASVRCSAAVTSAASRRRISGGGQNGHENKNDEGSGFCHDYSIGLANRTAISSSGDAQALQRVHDAGVPNASGNLRFYGCRQVTFYCTRPGSKVRGRTQPVKESCDQES
jgi:hypothetical protein